MGRKTPENMSKKRKLIQTFPSQDQWMSGVQGKTIMQLAIPGSHDSASFKPYPEGSDKLGFPYAQSQALSIYDQ